MGKELKKTVKRLAGLMMAFVLVAAALAPAYGAPTQRAFSLNADEVTIVVGKSFNFNINNKVKGSTYEWSVTNEEVARVNERGIVTGVGKGSTHVTCRIKVDGKTYLLRGKVNVLKPAVKVNITNPVETLDVGEYYRLRTEMIPKGATDILTWTSSNEDIVRVDQDGSFVGVESGEVTLTVTSVSGRSDSVTIQIGDETDVEDADIPEDEKDDTVDEPEKEMVLGKVIYEEKFENSVGGFKGRDYSTAKVAHVTAGKAAEGKGYMSVTGRTGAWHGAIVDVTDLVVPGGSYQVSAWVRYTTGEDVEIIKASMQTLTREGDTYPAITGDKEINKGEWTKITGTMVVPPSSTKSQVYFEANSLIDFFVDHVVIQEIDTEIIEEDLSGIEPAEIGDIVYKNDFEGDKILDPRANSVRTITTEVSHSGKSSLEVKRENGWDGAGVKFTSANDIEILSLQGRTVRASFYVMYKDGPDEVQFKLNNRMETADNADTILSQIAVKKGEWTLIEADCLIADGAPADLIFIETDGTDALTFHIDDVEIQVIK